MEEKIKNIIKKELQLEALEITPIKEGFSHEKFLIKTNGTPKEVILRFENTSLESKRRGLGAEKFIIEKLLENKLPAPKTYGFNNQGDNLEEHYIILEKLSGTRLDTIWDNLSKKEKIQITKEIGSLLSKIHEIKLEKFGWIRNKGEIESNTQEFKFRGTPEYEVSHSKYLREYLSDFMRDFSKLISYKTLKKELPEKFMRYLMGNIEELDYLGKPTLIHGDFHKDHIFIEKNPEGNFKITGLIDFEFGAVLAPEYDMLKLHRQELFDDPCLLEAFKKGYGEFNIKAVEVSRLMRDIMFAIVLFDSGKISKSLEVFNSVEERIDKDLNQQT